MIRIKRNLACLLLAAAVLVLLPAMTAGAASASVSKKSETLSGGKWKSRKVSGKRKYRYKKSDGKYAKNGWKKIDGEWYCLNKSGYALTGLVKVNGKFYLFASSGGAGKTGALLTGLQTVKGKEYFFRTSGNAGTIGSRVESDWVTIDGVQRYFCQNGVIHPQKRLTETEFIEKVGKLAKEDMEKTGILASVTIAQAILESGYGSTSLAMEANNFFGMKAALSNNDWASEWDRRTFTKKTQEWYGNGFVTITADFRAYADMAASIRDHSNYLRYAKNGKKLRYPGVSGNKKYKETIQIIKDGGYATDPEYVSKICNIITRFKLTKYDK